MFLFFFSYPPPHFSHSPSLSDKPNISQSIDKVLSVTMTYSADGKPSPGYTRTLPNTTIISNSSISISSFREEDWGQYTCIASNYLGQATWNVIITANRECKICINTFTHTYKIKSRCSVVLQHSAGCEDQEQRTDLYYNRKFSEYFSCHLM